MEGTPYSQFDKEKLILRDLLAIDRTELANERTFLAYIRTALAIFITGLTFIKFFNSWLYTLIGWVFIPLGVGFQIVGFLRYRKMKVLINKDRFLPEQHAVKEMIKG